MNQTVSKAILPPTGTQNGDSDTMRWVKLVVFGVVGVALLLGGAIWQNSTRAFASRAERATGTVIRLNAGGSHPEIRFVTKNGQVVEYAQNGLVWGYKVGDTATVLYDPSAPSAAPQVETWGALYGFPTLTFAMALSSPLSPFRK